MTQIEPRISVAEIAVALWFAIEDAEIRFERPLEGPAKSVWEDFADAVQASFV